MEVIKHADITVKRPSHAALLAAAQPLLHILNEYYHPHATIIMDQTHIEIVTGDMAAPFKLRD